MIDSHFGFSVYTYTGKDYFTEFLKGKCELVRDTKFFEYFLVLVPINVKHSMNNNLF